MTTKQKPLISALAPWYGGNRMLAQHVGEALEGCSWVGIPFAGGMCEIGHITARTIVANDLHEGIICLASVLSVPDAAEKLQGELGHALFHPTVLTGCQATLNEPREGELSDDEILVRAFAYFVVAWMTRSGTAGTPAEGTAGIALRWEASGGDSAKRFRSAVDSLPYWSEQFRRCTFSSIDCLEFLDKCKDRVGHGVYCDPPFLNTGTKYRHTMSELDHQAMAARLHEFEATRVVVRYYDHPIVRELYPEGGRWEWRRFEGRTQANKAAPEVLIVSTGN